MRPIRLPPDLANQPKVPDETCAELARISRLALKVFGRPMVLEWALVDDAVWIVDAIPLDAVEDMAGEEEAEGQAEPTPPEPEPASEEAPTVERPPPAPTPGTPPPARRRRRRPP